MLLHMYLYTRVIYCNIMRAIIFLYIDMCACVFSMTKVIEIQAATQSYTYGSGIAKRANRRKIRRNGE